MRSKRAWGIVAFGAILIGLIMVSIVLILYYTGHPGVKIIVPRERFIVEEAIRDIEIESSFADVKIVISSSKSPRSSFEVPDGEQLYCEHELVQGKLTIRLVDERAWYEKMGDHHIKKESTIVLYLPFSYCYGDLTIKTASGDVYVPYAEYSKKNNSFAFETVNVETSSGDIDFCAGVAMSGVSYGSASFTTKTGDVKLEGIRNAPLRVETSTGDIQLINSSFEGDVEISTSSGEVQLSNVSLSKSDIIYIKASSGDVDFFNVDAGAVKVETDTGDVELSNVVIQGAGLRPNGHSLMGGDLRIETDTGDVELKRSDAQSLFVTTDTGDVEIELLTGKYYSVKSDTGDVKHPEHDQHHGQCHVTTDTGDVEITVISK